MAETYRIRGHFSVRQTALEVFGSTERERERGRQRERERGRQRERERESFETFLDSSYLSCSCVRGPTYHTYAVEISREETGIDETDTERVWRSRLRLFNYFQPLQTYSCKVSPELLLEILKIIPVWMFFQSVTYSSRTLSQRISRTEDFDARRHASGLTRSNCALLEVTPMCVPLWDYTSMNSTKILDTNRHAFELYSVLLKLRLSIRSVVICVGWFIRSLVSHRLESVVRIVGARLCVQSIEFIIFM